MSQIESLLDSRLVLVTGKGGTGKTTVAAALAKVCAARGERTVLCEVDAQHPVLASLFDAEVGFDPVEVEEDLFLANLTFTEALRAFLIELIPSRRVVKLVLNNPVVQRFLDFTPGSREMVTLSAIEALTQRYDRVIVDLPASGHAFALLDITRSALGLFRSGPIRRRAAQLRQTLRSPQTRVALVALPEEMVVNETLETWERLRTHQHLGQPPIVFLNRATRPSLTPPERQLIEALDGQPLDPHQRELVRAGVWEDALEQRTESALERLSVIGPPILIAPARAGSSPESLVHTVTVSLGRQVGLSRHALTQIYGEPPASEPRTATVPHPPPGPTATWLDDRRLVVCVGAGGVGKTTTAASLALRGALRGRKTIVLTIDPARRLANSLGLSSLGNAAQRIDLGPLQPAPGGELWAMMLDSRSTFDELVARFARDEATRDRILNNHVYRHMSETYAGSQDYMATERLHDLVSSGDWDVVVLDTPPVKNALDFLESPGRLVHFLDERVLHWFLHPYDPSLVGGRLRLGTSAVVYKLLGYVFGSEFLTDLSTFFQDFKDLYAGFRERHEAVLGMLRAPDTAFVSVCGPTESTLEIALFFQEELARRELPQAGVVVNQVHTCDSDDHDAIRALSGQISTLSEPPDERISASVLARLGMAHRRLRELTLAEQGRVAGLQSRLDSGTFYVEVPRFEHDIHDLPGLEQVQRAVFPAEAERCGRA